MTEESNWDIVLKTIYEDDIWWQKGTDIDEDHPIVQAVDMDAKTVQNSLAYLSQVQLIGNVKAGMQAEVPRPGKEAEVAIADQDRRTGLYIGLTPRGFSVAHDREMRRQRDKEDQRKARQQHDVNLAVAILTLGLLSLTVVDSAVRAFVGGGSLNWAYASLVIGVILLISFGWILYWNELLSPFTTDGHFSRG